MKQLFQIPYDLLHSVKPEVAMDTFSDMVDLDIANPPYPEFGISTDWFVDEYGKRMQITFWYAPTKDNPEILKAIEALYKAEGRNPDYPFETILVGYEIGKARLDLKKYIKWGMESSQSKPLLITINRMTTSYVHLIVLLATKNVIKTTVRNRLAKFGVGKQRAEYVTTLSIGTITETEYEHGTPSGREVRPHLRRGHIRNQRHGPELIFVKKIWVQPVFVNSDREYVPAERVAYNVSKFRPNGPVEVVSSSPDRNNQVPEENTK